MKDNKQFWSKVAWIYERFVRSGKHAQKAYEEMEKEICHYLNERMDVLELAAGPGVLSETIAKSCKTLEATDFAESMIEVARKKNMPSNIHFAVADATNLIYNDGQFDAVVIANALHIMPNPTEALKEIKRVLKDGGILIAPTFTREYVEKKWVERLMEMGGFKTFSKWTHETYQAFLREQGWQVCIHKVIKGHNFPISFVVCKEKRG